uniref:Uncharacterized protein n=1 Tax=Sexangularia sp. CB-2014 TaxID=1486929 RepID=A0A7S1YKX4_9EUKA|mmetsp:Transcript_7691/g.24663  ORF Transcript_7691/g.24663 Transcript_7691/m.24663 type:complete len:223 (+) Transcript_7691:82-750(+)
MSAVRASRATDRVAATKQAVQMGDAVNEFAAEVRYRLHANLPNNGERQPLIIHRAPALLLRATMPEYLSLNLKLKKPAKRRRAVQGKVQTDKTYTARYVAATDLEGVFGTNWFLSYDGRNFMVIMGPILIDFVQHRWSSRRWTRDDAMRQTPTVEVDHAIFYDMKVQYSYSTIFWDQPDALKHALSLAGPPDDEESDDDASGEVATISPFSASYANEHRRPP